jgi:hypothetical protein
MDEENVVSERASTRCFVCRLPDEVLANLHADRFEGGMGFEALARKYGLPDRPLSESGCRRHFARHVVEPQGDDLFEPASADVYTDAAASTPDTPAGNDLDGLALLEAGTKTLAEMVQTLAHEHREAVQQRPQAAERAFAKFMKAQSELAKSVRQLEAGRAVREEFRKTVPAIVERCTLALMRSIVPLMRANAAKVCDEVIEYENGRLGAEEFFVRLARLEAVWPKEVALRLKAARIEALRAEEATL